MGMTLTEKILAKASGKEKVEAGEVVTSKVNTLMMHDVTSTGAIKILNENFGRKIAPGLKVVVTPDHYVPNKDIKSAMLYKELKDFVDEQKIESAYMVEGGDYGVCHVMLPEKGYVIPGEVIVGADSHTCTYGALGAFSTGVGSTESGSVLGTGKMWFKVPETYKIVVDGKLPGNVMAKDVFLHVVGKIGVDGALYKAMEWSGSTINDMSLDERMTLTNMAIEAGAKSGIIAPDDKTVEYVKNRSGKDVDISWLFSDKDAKYSSELSVDASKLEPLVAKPDLPSNVASAKELSDVKIDQAYIGSCTGGKITDFIAAAEVLKGKKIAKGVRLLVVPSTSDIQKEMVKTGLYEIFMDAGAVFYAPTCGACLGGHAGILAEGEVAISATNRNFRGRMGHPDSFVYLASPKTVAESAVRGYIRGAKK